MDWGKFGAKIALSFQSYIQSTVVKAMTDVSAAPATSGLAGYTKVGASKANFIQLAELVKAANGGSEVYALGTKGALSQVVPSETGFRFSPSDDLTTKGVLREFAGVKLVEIDNALIPKTINSNNPTLAIPDTYIYFIPMAYNKPVKVVFEGNNLLVTEDAIHSKDNTFAMTVSMYLGVDVIAGSKFGILAV